MNDLDERLRYLAQSTGSLHANIERLYETVSKQAESIAQNDAQIKQVIKATSVDAENIRALAAIAEAHQEQLDRLEGDQTR